MLGGLRLWLVILCRISGYGGLLCYVDIYLFCLFSVGFSLFSSIFTTATDKKYVKEEMSLMEKDYHLCN